MMSQKLVNINAASDLQLKEQQIYVKGIYLQQILGCTARLPVMLLQLFMACAIYVTTWSNMLASAVMN
jgi:hypothetical protein